jgi:hypothetical protein
MKKFLFSRLNMSVGTAVAACVALVAPSALANAGSTSCPTFAVSQPFLSSGDSNLYTLVPGQSQDNFDGTGWTLSGGANVAAASLANGNTGSVLDLPPGSSATSPVMCVQNGMPSARMLTNALGSSSNGDIQFQAWNADGSRLSGNQDIPSQSGWSVSDPLTVAPGNFSAVKQVYFTLKAKSNSAEQQVYNFFVDPRMWW